MVIAGLLTGLRYGDLTRLSVDAFHPETRTLSLRISKVRQTVNIALDNEALTFLKAKSAAKLHSDLFFRRADGEPWKPSDQSKRMRHACQVAGIKPASFGATRHTYASRLVMAGTPLLLVAAQLGHSTIDMVQQHYGHLCPNFVADRVMALKPIGLFRTSPANAPTPRKSAT
jgi:integrase